MSYADELYEKLKELEELIRENTNTDGSLNFDLKRVMVSLELARQMMIEKSDFSVDGETRT